MKFQSAVDPWFYWLGFVFPASIFIVAVWSTEPLTSASIPLFSGLAVILFGLPIWLLLSTYYLVETDHLNIRSGPFRWSIPLNDIKFVKPSCSSSSSPALSLQRLEIGHGRSQAILVSPKDAEGFKNAIGH